MPVAHAARRAIDADASTGNALLDIVSPPTRERLLSEAERVCLTRGQVLFAPGAPLNEVYFPITCVCSFLLTLESGQSAETSTAGNEGMVGLRVAIGGAPNQSAIVQVPGEAWKLRADLFREGLGALPEFRDAIHEYVGYVYHVAQQWSLCNAYHSVEQRLARWLLTARDRAHSDRFPVTQQLLSEMVAATRPRVAECLLRFRSTGLVTYRRGCVEVTDAPGLGKLACECYALTRRSPAPSA
jgi:CRP-like cAMP-binding protein